MTQSQSSQTLHFYQTCDKMYWEMNAELLCEDGRLFERNERVPCLFVVSDEKAGAQRIIQIDKTIAHDDFRYTAFRSVLGHACGGRKVSVYLVPRGAETMYDLNGRKCLFDDLLSPHDDCTVDKQWIGIMQIK